MERLTEKKEADAQRQEYEKRLKNGYPRNIPEERFLKLAAYEDTGLGPEEIDSVFIHGVIEENRRFKELAKAEKEGRLVVIPCKNDTVYTIEEDYFNCDKCRHGDSAYYQAKIDRISCDMNNGVHCPLYVKEHEVDGFEVKFDTFGAVILSGPGEFGYEGLEQFSGIDGKVYYTREEAEAALKKNEEADNEHEH